MLKLKELGTVFIRVTDVEKSVPFYTEVIGLTLREIENWEVGRGANFLFPNQSILLTLIEQTENFEPLKQPTFNLFCHDIVEHYEWLKSQGVKVGDLNIWSSEWNDHIDFDVYDPDGNAINLIEWKPRQ